MKRGEGEADILTPEEVAKWLQIEKRQLERFGIPCIYLGHKTRRYLKAEVFAFLQHQRKARVKVDESMREA